MHALKSKTSAALAALITAGLVSGLVVAAAPAARASFPGKNGPVVSITAAGNVVKIDPTTGLTTTLCTGCANPGAAATNGNRPAVSPDGQTIAFELAGNGPLGLMSINGGSVTTVNGSIANDIDPTFTPDGKTLVATNLGPGGTLFTISATGAGGRTTIFGAPTPANFPEVSPDGSTVAFQAIVGAAFVVDTIPIAGGAVTQRSRGLGGGDQLSWSPDGTKLAVFDGACTPGPIGIISASGTNQAPTCLPNVTGSDEDPSWSPDGTKIALGNVSTAVISIVNADGSPGRTTLPVSNGQARVDETWWANAATTTTTTASGPTTTTTTPCFGTLSGSAFKGSHAKLKKALAGVVVSAAPTPTGTTLTGTTNAAGQYSFTVPCGTYNKTATGPANNSRTCHFGSGKGPLTAVAQVTSGSNYVENLFCKSR